MGNRTGTISKRYRVKHDADIHVTPVVGAGQPGGWSLALDNQPIAEGVGEKTVTLGKGADLVYRELRVEFVIHDQRAEHDRLIATILIRGGDEDMTLVHEEDGAAGDSATYTILVQFV